MSYESANLRERAPARCPPTHAPRTASRLLVQVLVLQNGTRGSAHVVSQTRASVHVHDRRVLRVPLHGAFMVGVIVLACLLRMWVIGFSILFCSCMYTAGLVVCSKDCAMGAEPREVRRCDVLSEGTGSSGDTSVDDPGLVVCSEDCECVVDRVWLCVRKTSNMNDSVFEKIVNACSRDCVIVRMCVKETMSVYL